MDKNGVKQWDVSYGGGKNDFLNTALLLNNGNLILGGNSFSGKSGVKSEQLIGVTDFWVLVVSSVDGSILWDATLGGDASDVMTSVFINGGIYLGGYSNSDASGSKTENSYGGYDYWIVHLNALTGAKEWDYTYGGTSDDYLQRLVLNERTSSFYASGTSSSGIGGTKTTTNDGGSDYWLMDFDSLGNKKWENNIGGTGTDVLTDMITSKEGAVIIGGYSNSGVGGDKFTSNNGGYDYWIVKVDSFGQVFWERTYGGALDDTLTTLHERCDRGLYAGGHSMSGISGDKTYANHGDQDYWVIKLNIPTLPDFLAADHCYGTVMQFSDISNIWPDEWKWDFGDPLSGVNSANERNPLHQFSSPGNYTISLTVKEGC